MGSDRLAGERRHRVRPTLRCDQFSAIKSLAVIDAGVIVKRSHWDFRVKAESFMARDRQCGFLRKHPTFRIA